MKSFAPIRGFAANWRTSVALSVVVLLSFAAHAQLDRAGLNGTVTDPTGRVLPRTQVSALRDETGLQRVTFTTDRGTFDIPELPVGIYTVTFAHDGFQPLTIQNVVQVVQHTRTLNATLQVSGGKQQIDVSASSSPLDETSDTTGARIEPKQVKELPLNGRNWATLTVLAPTAVDNGGSNQRSIRFAGRGRDDNNFTYDGIDATNIINQAQQPYVRLAIPLETIQEFRVVSTLATAETGETAGGQMSVTSASGTNRFHGTAFEFFRNNVFDARQPTDALNPTRPQPPFHLNQFGGSFGGPIARNKTFLFASYEGYRQILGQSLSGFVPTDSFRTQVAAQSPALIPILNAYPEGQTALNAVVAQFGGEGRQLVNEDSGMIRVDHHFSDKTTGFVRVNIDQAVSNVPLASSGQYLNGLLVSTSGPANVAIELLHIFSPTLVNEGKFGFNRSTAINTNVNQTGTLYAISVPGFTTLNNNRLSTGVGNSFSWIDNLTKIRGRHVIKAGAEVRRIQLNQGSTANGTVSYASAAAFLANQVNTATLTDALPINGLRKTMYFGYLQDEFKWRPTLTLNLGARYSFFNIFHEVQGRANPFDFATCGGFCGVGASFGQPNYADIDPRVAFAWAPTRLARNTVIRGGFGIYHQDGQLEDQNLPVSNEVQRFSLSSKTTPGLSYPIDPFLVGATGIISPRAMDRLRQDMYVSEWGLSIQQALPRAMVGTISYIGSKGTHLLTLSEVNVVNPATGTRPYPAFGQVDWRGNDNNSSYQGLVLSLQRAFRSGLLFSVNYTWSHEIDDGSMGSGDGDSLTPENVACRSCERANGVWDARHVVNANVVYELPFGPGKPYLNQPGFLRTMFGSWESSTIVAAHTGFPVNVTVDRAASTVPDGNTNNQRPDLIPGVSLTPPGGSSSLQWINPAAFAVPAPNTFGNAPRNLLRGPGLWQTDVGLAKHIPITERVQLQFRAEAFNVFNRAQWGSPQANISNAAAFGRILSTVNTGPVGTGTPRQLQFMLKAQF